MKIKIDEPSIPMYIRQKILNLQILLEQADILRDEILVWYNAATPFIYAFDLLLL